MVSDRRPEQLVTHAGHPCDANRWCVNDVCNDQALAAQAAERGDDPLDVFASKEPA